jgi:CBS domain-containing protein
MHPANILDGPAPILSNQWLDLEAVSQSSLMFFRRGAVAPRGRSRMKCIDLIGTKPEMLSQKDTIAYAAGVMAEASLGFLPICDGDRKVLGVVTDRDIVVRAMAKGLDPTKTLAATIMTAPAITCLADADLQMAEDLMAEEGKARVVLIHADGTLAGIVSIGDVIANAPRAEAVHTLKAVLWQEAIGPRAGAAVNQPLLKDLPIVPRPREADLPHTMESVFSGGHRDNGTKEFPS